MFQILSRAQMTFAAPDPTSLPFPLTCQQCASPSGLPAKATTLPDGGVAIDVRCRTCDYEWQCVMPPADLTFAPKRDRRKKSQISSDY